MNFRLVIHLISLLIVLEGGAVCISSGVAALMGDSGPDILLLFECGLGIAFSGILGMLFTKHRESGQAGFREGFAVVTFGWLLISIFGSVPFIIVTDMNWYDAIFETVSGFSTTGATLIDKTLPLRTGKTLPDGIESLSYGILFWRSLTHWA